MPSHRVLLELTRRYTEPHRHYHTIEHVAQMLHAGRNLALTDEQVLAIWFHDAVYEPGASTNEEESARLAVELLTAEDYPEEGINAVEAMVHDTRTHEPGIEESKAVIDLDLASLALPRQYEANGRRIRQEYAALSEAEFDRGRRTFAERCLRRERIFWTEWGAKLEARARANLRRDAEG